MSLPWTWPRHQLLDAVDGGEVATADNGGMTQRRLRILWGASTVTARANELQRAGLARPSPAQLPVAAQLWRLTAAGREQLAGWNELHGEVWKWPT